jgi:hypothetical protein
MPTWLNNGMPRYLAKYYFWIRLWSAWLLEPGHWTLALGLRLLSSAFLIRLSDLDWKYSTDFPGFMVCRLQSGISQPPQSHKSIPYNRALSLSLSLSHSLCFSGETWHLSIKMPNNKIQKMDWRCSSAAEHLPSKREVLNSNPSPQRLSTPNVGADVEQV